MRGSGAHHESADPLGITLATYEATARRFQETGVVLDPSVRSFLDRIVDRVGVGGHVLELGSGPGRDARYLEGCGVRVRRSDATRAFVDILREDGDEAQLLDVRAALTSTGWSVDTFEHVQGRVDPWMHVCATAIDNGSSQAAPS